MDSEEAKMIEDAIGDGNDQQAQAAEPRKVGSVNDADSRVVRIVHISDTHLMHADLQRSGLIPQGDILVHSGDFGKFSMSRNFNCDRDYRSQIELANAFFQGLPHRVKIFVAGNHETNFPRHSREQTAQLLSSTCVYLQDASVTVDGIVFYGTPWNGLRHNSFARSFTKCYSRLSPVWQTIPAETDVLVTHSPSFGVLDLGSNKHPFNVSRFCQLCQTSHKEFMHFGCPTLLSEVLHRVRPKAHLFGHAHEPNGTKFVDEVLFSNAAMTIKKSANVIDYYVSADTLSLTDLQPHYHRPADCICTVM